MSNIGTIELDDLIYPITPADQIEKELDNFNTGVKELMEEFANKTGAYIESIDVSSFYSSSGSVDSRFMFKGREKQSMYKKFNINDTINVKVTDDFLERGRRLAEDKEYVPFEFRLPKEDKDGFKLVSTCFKLDVR